MDKFHAIENLKNGDRLKADEISMLIANGKFSRANIDANNALNGNMTAKEGEKYTQRALFGLVAYLIVHL
jgi:hypothetical protein